MRTRVAVAAALALLPARMAWTQQGSPTTAPPADGAATGARTIARLVATPSLAGTAPVRPTWSPDGRRLAFLWNTESRAREVWTTTRAGDAPVRVTRFTEATPRCVPTEFTWLAATDAMVVLCGGDLWTVIVSRREATRLTTDGGAKSDLTLSPDGVTLAWLRDGDLWTMRFPDGTPARRTTLGVAPPDSIALGTYWRMEREVGRATWASDAPPYAWSPDSRTIALHVVDRRALPQVPFPYYLGRETAPHALRRSYPGQPNEARAVQLLDVATGALRPVALEAPESWRVVELAWSPAGTLLVDRERDDAIERALHLVTADGTVRTAYRDRRASRVYTDIGSTWHPDGRRIVVTSDREDRYRAYLLTPGDTVPRAVTPATADIAGAAIGAGRARLFWASTDPDPAERHVWMRDGEGAPVRLTTSAGQHAPVPSPDGGALAVLSSSDTMPPELFVMEARAGAPMRRVTVSPTAEFRRHAWIPARYVQIPSRTPGVSLHLRILEPPGMDRSRRHPVLLGPVYSNTVRNRWAGLYGMFQQHLAVEKGYVVVQVDVRGSTGYGRAFREAFLMDWGGGDLDDLEDVVRWLRAQPHVDPRRIGVWGSSYGGTLTVYSLFRKPGLFNAGVAGAPATDPFAFGSDDVAIVRTPQAFPATFERGALQWAKELRDPLLIIHGLMDDVVPFRTTAILAEELMRQGKDFELAIAPGATHGWTARPHHAAYLLGRLVEFFERKMPAVR